MISETALLNTVSDPGESTGQGKRSKKFKGKITLFGKLIVFWWQHVLFKTEKQKESWFPNFYSLCYVVLQYMKTMGVYPAIHFFAWFLENVIVFTESSCALAIILKASGIFAYSNGFLIFLFLLEFGVTVIMLSYFLGAFFSSADTAALCASLVYMISFLPYILLLVLQNQLSFISQIIMVNISSSFLIFPPTMLWISIVSKL